MGLAGLEGSTKSGAAKQSKCFCMNNCGSKINRHPEYVTLHISLKSFGGLIQALLGWHWIDLGITSFPFHLVFALKPQTLLFALCLQKGFANCNVEWKWQSRMFSLLVHILSSLFSFQNRCDNGGGRVPEEKPGWCHHHLSWLIRRASQTWLWADILGHWCNSEVAGFSRAPKKL